MKSLSNSLFWTILLATTAIGGFIRLYDLGGSDTRSDEVYMLQPPASQYTPVQQLVAESEMFRDGRTLVIPRTTATAFIYFLRLDPTQFITRFPYALMGILTIPALCLLGVRLGDRRLGLILAFLGAISPFNVYFSRLAHVYAFPMFFCTLATTFFVQGMRAAASGGTMSRRDVFLLWLCALCACHTHISTWPAIGLLWLALLAYYYLVQNIRSEGRWRLLIAFGTWALVMSPWVVIFLHSLLSADKAYHPPSYVSMATQFHRLLHLPLTMGWGGGFPRIAASIGLPLMAVAAAISRREWRAPVILASGLGLIVLVVLGAGQYLGGADISTSRYYVPLWLMFVFLSGIGIAWLGDLAESRMRIKANSAQVALCALLGLMTFHPIVWTLTLPGHPTPYSKINERLDRVLPKGAPVLVDRWFEPWNEMLYHSPSNVHVTFTIPDEPLNNFQDYHWRDTAKNFFRKYPDAAYLELVKHYFHVPEVGFWHWPREYFRRREVVSNEQAYALGNISLMPDPFAQWAGSNTNRIVVEIFYNRPEDVVQMARERGDKVLRMYGSGWGYTKLWRQMQGDFRDWRVLEREAFIDVYNLSDSALDVRMEITGAAVPGNKQVQSSSGNAFRFDGQQIKKWTFIIKNVEPGRRQIMLRDPLWPSSESVLLVGELEVSVADDTDAENTEP